MTEVLAFLATNALVATVLLGIGLLADRFCPWPALRHLVWTAVLLQLLLPPVISIDVSLPRQFAGSTVATEDTRHAAVLHAAAADPHRATVASAAVPIATTLLAIELAGAALILGLALTRWRRIAQLLRATETPPADLQRRAHRAANRLGIRVLPRLRTTEERVVPMLVALPVPTIVLSRPLVEALCAEEVDALLCHELAHMRRGDAWLRPVELLVTALYWWLPTLWIARRRLHRAEEAACDSIVVGTNPALKRAYAVSLLKAIELTTPLASAALATGSAEGRDIKERINTILKLPGKQAPRGVLRIAAAFALLAALAGPTWAPAEQAPREREAGATGAVAKQRRELSAHEQLQVYLIEHTIQQVGLEYEMARIAATLAELEAGGRVAAAAEARSVLEALALEREHLDARLDFRELESRLAADGYGHGYRGATGEPTRSGLP